jgi:hypothetical protein
MKNRVQRTQHFKGVTVQLGQDRWQWWLALSQLGLFLKRNTERYPSAHASYVVVAGLGFKPLRWHWNRQWM